MKHFETICMYSLKSSSRACFQGTGVNHSLVLIPFLQGCPTELWLELGLGQMGQVLLWKKTCFPWGGSCFTWHIHSLLLWNPSSDGKSPQSGYSRAAVCRRAGARGLVSSLLAPLGAPSGRSTLGWGAGQQGVSVPMQHPSIPLAGGLRGAWP